MQRGSLVMIKIISPGVTGMLLLGVIQGTIA
jgi:hypothetical protein